MKLVITEHQGDRSWPSAYRFVRRGPHGGAVFQEDGGSLEFFAKRKDPPAGWHLRRGAYTYEFCCREGP
jgi:hypothetical protein